MRKQNALTGAVVCSLALAGCMLASGCEVNVTVTDTSAPAQTQEAASGSAQVANPVHEGTLAEVAEATGLELNAPEGATDVVYSYIDGIDGAAPMAQTTFTLDGKAYCYRAQPTSKVTLVQNGESLNDAAKALENAVDEAQAFTGVYGSFGNQATFLVSQKEGIMALNNGKAGFVEWLDVVPGIQYSLSMDDGATQDLLSQTAEACFVPVQGEA